MSSWLILGGEKSGKAIKINDGWSNGDLYRIPIKKECALCEPTNFIDNDYEEYRLDTIVDFYMRRRYRVFILSGLDENMILYCIDEYLRKRGTEGLSAFRIQK